MLVIELIKLPIEESDSDEGQYELDKHQCSWTDKCNKFTEQTVVSISSSKECSAKLIPEKDQSHSDNTKKFRRKNYEKTFQKKVDAGYNILKDCNITKCHPHNDPVKLLSFGDCVNKTSNHEVCCRNEDRSKGSITIKETEYVALSQQILIRFFISEIKERVPFLLRSIHPRCSLMHLG